MNSYNLNNKSNFKIKDENLEIIDHKIKQLDKWLLSHRVCNQFGAVAGVLIDDKSCYWYSEIAGYYLSYLAYLRWENKTDKTILNSLTLKTSNWLKNQWNNTSRKTRIYPKETKDWRNSYIFSFDLAMVLRGLADVKAQNLELAWDGKKMADFFSEFISKNSNLEASLLLNKYEEDKSKWSLKAGAYQWKTLSGLVRYAKQFKHSSLFSQVNKAMNQLEKLSRNKSFFDLPSHPFLYSMEGILDCQLSLKLNLDLIKSTKKESWRTDVLAQTLRLKLVKNTLKLNDELSNNQIVDQLIKSINNQGRIGFIPCNHDTDNVWCGIFARQALADFIQNNQSHRKTISLFI